MSSAPATEAPPSSMSGSLGGNPVDGIKKAHADMLAGLYKPHGALVDEQAKKLDQAGVKREHVAYGIIGVVSLYLLCGKEALFVSALIGFSYPAYHTVQIIRSRSGAEALNQLLYWIVFGFFSVLDSSAISLLPAYFFLKTVFLVFLFLPQTHGTQLIYHKVIDPMVRAIDGTTKKR